MLSNQKQIIEQDKFTYSLLGKTFKKQTKTIEYQEEKQINEIQIQEQVQTIKEYTLINSIFIYWYKL